MATIIVYPNVNSGDFEIGFFDGTTVTSKNIFSGAGNSSQPQYFTHFGSQLVFQATDGNGRELWITDGTAAGTHQVADINPGAGSAFTDDGTNGAPVISTDFIKDESPAVLNGKIFFGADDGTHGREPWVSDGTNGAGTHMLMDIRAGANVGSGAHDFVVFNNFVYFIANDGTHDEVWKTDGTTTSKVTNLPGVSGSGPEFASLTVSGSHLFFTHLDASNNHQELYVLDGTAAGAHAVPIDPIPDGATVIPLSAPTNMTDVNGTLYFGLADDKHGTELWKSDGTTATFIKNIGANDIPAIPIFNNGNPSNFVAFNGEVYFVAVDDQKGSEIFKTDGTEAGTVRVTDINNNIGVLTGYSIFSPVQLVVVNNALYFAANDSSADHELYKLDTNDIPTKININTTNSSSPFALLGVGGNLYFAATPTGGSGPALFKYDGTNFTKLADDYTNATNVVGISYEWMNAITGPTLNGTIVLTSATEHVAIPGGTTVASFTDSDLTATAGDFAATIAWGDGVTDTGTIVGSSGSFSVQGAHIYADEGNFTATVTFTHLSDATTATASGSVAVAEHDQLTAHATTFSSVANTVFSGTVATFDDTDLVTLPGDLTATIAWGDGVTDTGTITGSNGSFTVSGTHTYIATGQKTVWSPSPTTPPELRMQSRQARPMWCLQTRRLLLMPVRRAVTRIRRSRVRRLRPMSTTRRRSLPIR